jgi:hypothetical protein
MWKTGAALIVMGALWVTPVVAQNRSGMDAGTPTSPNTVNTPASPATSDNPKATTDTKNETGTRHHTKTSRNKGCPSGQTRESANGPCVPISQSRNTTK